MKAHASVLGALLLALAPVRSSTGEQGRGVGRRHEVAPAASTGDTAPVEPDFSYEELMTTAVAATGRGDWTGAAGELKRLLEADERLSERQRAEVHFAVGLVQSFHELERPAPASQGGFTHAAGAFDSARALAGPGRLRLDATYDLASAVLHHAERWRSEIPEIAQAAGTPTPPPPAPPAPPAPTGGPPPASADEAPPDPLAQARAAYLEARERLIERLRADWRDADTRADLELVWRRLRELDEIERQRQEQQQEGGEESDGEEGQEGEENPEEDSGSEGSESSGDQDEGEDGEPQDPEQDPEDSPEPDGEPRAPETTEAPRPEDGEARGRKQPAERLLTREEVMRLFDKLEQLEKEGEALRAALGRARRIPVERDW